MKAVKGKTGIKSQIDMFNEDLSSKYSALLKEIRDIGDNVDYAKSSFTGGNKKVYGLKNFKRLEKLIEDMWNRDMTIDDAEIKQNKFAEKTDELRAYPARGSK